MGDHISGDELSILTTTSLTEQELDDTPGGRIFVGVSTDAMTAMMCWGPGAGLPV